MLARTLVVYYTYGVRTYLYFLYQKLFSGFAYYIMSNKMTDNILLNKRASMTKYIILC